MRVNKRLTVVSSYIEDNSNVIDVGCDHALLCIYLVKEKNNINCIASDIKKGPLIQAENNIKEFNLSKRIKIKEGNGLDTIEDNIDTIVISGMGGNNIIDIINRGISKLNNIKRMVLSPNCDFYSVRKNISDLGFIITKEEIVCDKDKFYSVMVFEHGKKKYKKEELLFGINVVINDDLLKYYIYLYNSFDEKVNNLPNKYFIQKIKLTFKKIKIKKLIKKYNFVI